MISVIYAGRCQENRTVGDIATSDPDHMSTFSDIFLSLGLMNVLNSTGPIHIFAPTNTAFDTLLHDILNISRGEFFERDSVLEKLLAYHVVVDDMAELGGTPTLLPGHNLILSNATIQDGMGHVGNITKRISAKNGEVFVIDRVLLPALQPREVMAETDMA